MHTLVEPHQTVVTIVELTVVAGVKWRELDIAIMDIALTLSLFTITVSQVIILSHFITPKAATTHKLNITHKVVT